MSDSIEERIASIVAARVGERLTALELAVTKTGENFEGLLDRKGLAAWAGCSVRMVDGWLKTGCPHVRLGGPGGSPRFLASEVWSWLQSRQAG